MFKKILLFFTLVLIFTLTLATFSPVPLLAADQSVTMEITGMT